MTTLFKDESINPKVNAQRNLCGRTHYVDDSSLRFHKSRILWAKVIDQGMLFAIVESMSLDPDGNRRGFRYVVFDVFGAVVSRVSLEGALSSRRAATTALWVALNKIDAKAHTLAAIDKRREDISDELAALAREVA